MRTFLLSLLVAFSFSATLRAEYGYGSCPAIQAGTPQASCASQIMGMIEQAQQQQSGLYTGTTTVTPTWDQYCASPQVISAMQSCLQAMASQYSGTSQLNSTYFNSSSSAAMANYSLDAQYSQQAAATAGYSSSAYSGYTGYSGYPYNESSNAINLTTSGTTGATGGGLGQ